MKQVIDGKLYNTETAEHLHGWDNGLYGGDFNRLAEDLYRTTKGAFFLHRDGGALVMHIPCGDGYTGGEEIVPLSKASAIEWLEDHKGTQVLLAEFADAIEEA